MKTLKLLTAAAIVALLSATMVQAKPFDKDQMCQTQKADRKEMKAIFDKLDLTAQQRMLLKENRKKMFASMKNKKVKQERKSRQPHMASFVSANGFDKEAFVKAAIEKAQIRAEYRAERFEKMMMILTPDQREMFAKLVRENQK
jgi:Spy/CpxP family protein refolding chaperone